MARRTCLRADGGEGCCRRTPCAQEELMLLLQAARFGIPLSVDPHCSCLLRP